MKNSTAIIVDPFSSGAQYAKRLREFGIESIAIISNPKLHPSYYRTFVPSDFNQVYRWNQMSMDENLTFLSNHNPVVVLAGSEPGVLLADLIAEKYELSSHKPGLRLARRDKWEMFQALSSVNLRTIKTKYFENAQEVIDWVAENGWEKCVVKPSMSAGSDGVHVCAARDDIMLAFESVVNVQNATGIKNEGVLVQEFIAGTEYVVDVFSQQGIHHVSAIWKYNKIIGEGGTVLYDTLELLPGEPSVEGNLVGYVRSCLDALGIQNGPSHNELFVDSEGPVLVESGARPHGGLGGPFISKLCIGYNQVDLVVNGLLNTEMFKTFCKHGYKPSKMGVEVFLNAPVSGTLNQTSVFDAVQSLKSYCFHQCKYSKGDKVVKSVDLLTIFGSVILASENRDTLQSDIEKVRTLTAESFKSCVS